MGYDRYGNPANATPAKAYQLPLQMAQLGYTVTIGTEGGRSLECRAATPAGQLISRHRMPHEAWGACQAHYQASKPKLITVEFTREELETMEGNFDRILTGAEHTAWRKIVEALERP